MYAKQVSVKLTEEDYAVVVDAAVAGGFKTVPGYLRAAGLEMAKRPNELEILKKEVKHGE